MDVNFRQMITAHHVMRLLIVSYFVALALGLIFGAEINRLATPFVSEDIARHIMRFIVLALAGMVLFGVQRRAAALLLSLVTFWASYLTLYAGGEIGAFWRDLALIGGLLLTAGIGGRDPTLLDADWEDDGDHDQDVMTIDDAQSPKAASRNAVVSEDKAFREDFDIVRAS